LWGQGKKRKGRWRLLTRAGRRGTGKKHASGPSFFQKGGKRTGRKSSLFFQLQKKKILGKGERWGGRLNCSEKREKKGEEGGKRTGRRRFRSRGGGKVGDLRKRDSPRGEKGRGTFIRGGG